MPEELSDIEEYYAEEGKTRDGQAIAINKKRDAAKLLKKDGWLAVIAVENQDKMNFVMPLRCMEYDVIDYVRQLRRLRRRHRKKGDLKPGEEYLSGIKAEDRLVPVFTILFYHGKGRWNVNREFHDMLDFKRMEETLKPLAVNYKMKVIALEDMEESNYETGLRELIGMMKRSGDREQMKAYYRENAERFRKMEEDTFDIICIMIHYRQLALQKEHSRNPEGRTIDMCRALDEMMEESRQEGKKEGKREGKMEGVRIGEKRGEKLGEKKGENRLGTLIDRLLMDNRISDVHAVAKSAVKRRKLYREYGIR